jgi:hypothetical protein
VRLEVPAALVQEANVPAITFPMPRAAPVTMAVFPRRLISMPQPFRFLAAFRCASQSR